MKILPLTLAVLLLFAVLPAQADDLAPGYWEQTPLPQTGLATFYAPGMMEYVQDYRQARGQLPDCPDCVGTVALLRAGDIGRKVWLQPADGERVGPFLVIDCARREDVAPLIARNWAVDVSFELGQAWGMVRPLDGVTVLEDPADAVPGAVALRVPTPFYVAPDKVVISPPTATPASAPLAPTRWPTRVPAGLQPHVAASPTAAIPTLPVPNLPPPLTPIVTTPTQVVTATPASAGDAGSLVLTPVQTPAPTATPAAPEVAVGRAGGGLLDPASVPTPPAFFWATATSTPRPPTQTPRPDLTPILPQDAGTVAPTPTPAASPLIRFWRDLLDRVFP